MLSKLNTFLKPGSRANATATDDDASSKNGVVSRVKELHPNLSIFHGGDSEVPFPTPSPPLSPSKHGRGSMFKRISRMPQDDNKETFSKATLPKKVKSLAALTIGKCLVSGLGTIDHLTVALTVTGSESSLGRASAELLARHSEETGRPSVESARTPVTPVLESKQANDGRFGSIRSILKPNNTPGTGQSVRFFSRDAYRVISPEQSSASEIDESALFNRMHQRSTHARPTVQQVFCPPTSAPSPPPKDTDSPTPGVASMMIPVSPPNVGNIFEFSEDDLPTIPAGSLPPLLDSAIEISETDEHVSSSFSTLR